VQEVAEDILQTLRVTAAPSPAKVHANRMDGYPTRRLVNLQSENIEGMIDIKINEIPNNTIPQNG
jgi:hypothetical protein